MKIKVRVQKKDKLRKQQLFLQEYKINHPMEVNMKTVFRQFKDQVLCFKEECMMELKY